MIQVQNVEEEIYSQCQNLLRELHQIETKEKLIDSKKIIDDLLEKIHYLTFLEKNRQLFISNSDQEIFNETYRVEEEIVDNNVEEKEQEEKKEVDTPYELNQGKEIEKEEETPQEKIESKRETETKKIKLSQIKNLITQSLFDEDELEGMQEKPDEVKEQIDEPKSFKRDFKLDFNDKLAFTKLLFDGSQLELNKVIKKLNTFDKIDDAKEYLSDLYYEKHWEKVDEYAQRLWFLVESKFI